MSLRSRTLRAKVLRLSRRAMRLTARGRRDESVGSARFSQLIWRRRCPPRLPRPRAAALHLHASHFLIRPDVLVSVQMHLAAARPGRAEVAGARSTRQRLSDAVLAAGPSARVRRARSAAESSPHRLQVISPFLESPARAVTVARRVIAGTLATWPARVLARPDVARRAISPAREAALTFPAARTVRARGGPMESRPERRQALRHESAFLPPLVRRRRSDQGKRESELAAFRAPAILAPVRLHRREAAAAGLVPANLPTWRDVAPVTLHYVDSRAKTPAAAPIEYTTATAAPAVASPVPAAAHSARLVAAAVLDRAATDRLADEVIRRIERRVRIERERRGI